MTSTATVSSSDPIKSLGLQPGDTLVVDEMHDDLVTVSLARRTSERSSALTTRQFLEKWAGKFRVPETEGDFRLADIIAKHVK